jgi:hypothetical protein
MKYFRAAALCLAAFVPAALGQAQDAQTKSVAILKPEEVVQKEGMPQLKPITRDIIWGSVEEGLVKTGKYKFLDRSRVEQTIAELSAQRDFDIYDQSSRKEFQRRLPADSIAVTDVTKDKDGISIKVSIINVETGEIDHSASTYSTVDKDEYIKWLTRRLAKRIVPQPPDTRTREEVIDEVKKYFMANGNIFWYSQPDNDGSMFAQGIFLWPGVFDLKGVEYRIESPAAVGKHFDIGKGTQKKWRRVVSDETSWEPVPEAEAAPASKGGGFLKGLAAVSAAAAGASEPSGPRTQPGVGNIFGQSLFVTDAEDVYVAGFKYFDYLVKSAMIWKNGKMEDMGDENAQFEEIWLWNNNTMFAVQQALAPAGGGLSSLTNSKREKSLWLDGEKIAEYAPKK